MNVTKKDDFILSLDLGTTAIKVGLFTISGDLFHLAAREQQLIFSETNRVEQSLTQTWQLVCDAAREVLEGVDTRCVLAVVLTNQRGSVVPIGRDGEPLMDLIVWMDHRGLHQVDRLKEIIGADDYYTTSGHPIVPITGVSKVLWLQNEAPEIWEQTESLGPPQTLFLRWLGCTESLVDFSSGSYLFPCDIHKRQWSHELAGKLAFPIERLPRLVPATEIVGKLDKKAAEDLGLPEGIPIVAGGGDGQCAAAGTGVVAPGNVMVNIGTATGVQVFLSQPAFDPAQTLNCAAHVVDDAWEMEGHTQASGAVLRWFRDEFGDLERGLELHGQHDAYELLIEQASAAPAGSNGLLFIPTFNGSTAPIVDPYARGVFLGLKLSHKRNHVIRAVLEGISLEIRWMLDAVSSTGVPVEEVRLAGGGSKNRLWNQIHADIFQRPIRTVRNPDAAMVGGAMCAAIALGAYADFPSAADAFVQFDREFEPDKERARIYEKTYEHYVRVFEALSQEQLFRS
jgi:xylulokinase